MIDPEEAAEYWMDSERQGDYEHFEKLRHRRKKKEKKETGLRAKRGGRKAKYEA